MSRRRGARGAEGSKTGRNRPGRPACRRPLRAHACVSAFVGGTGGAVPVAKEARANTRAANIIATALQLHAEHIGRRLYSFALRALQQYIMHACISLYKSNATRPNICATR